MIGLFLRVAFLTSMHPSIRHLNIRNISKIVTSKIILNTALRMQYNPDFCRQLGRIYLSKHAYRFSLFH